MRGLSVRHDQLLVGLVQRPKKRVDAPSFRLEGVKAVAKDNWEYDADIIAVDIEKGKVMILAQHNQRMFVRAW
jgi:sorting nexin-8